MSRPIRLPFLTLLFATALLGRAPAATGGCIPLLEPSCDDLCDAGSTQERCVIRSCKRILASASIDCGERDVWLEGGGARIWIEDAVLALRARDLVIGPFGAAGSTGSRIEARRRRRDTEDFGMVLSLSGALDVSGRVSARSNHGGGRILVSAAGGVLLRGKSKRNAIVACHG